MKECMCERMCNQKSVCDPVGVAGKVCIERGWEGKASKQHAYSLS
jgi:hypothetical protein